MKQNQIENCIAFVKDMLHEMQLGIRNPDNDTSRMPRTMFHEGEDKFIIYFHESSMYFGIVNFLHSTVPQLDGINRKIVEHAVQKAIRSALSMNPEITDGEKLDHGVQCIRDLLQMEPKTWRIYHEIKGAMLEEICLDFGRCRLLNCNDELFEKLIEPSQRVDSKDRESATILLKSHLSNYRGKMIGEITVYAPDENSALGTGLNDLRFILDVLNFFVDTLNEFRLIDGYLFLPGEWDSVDAPTVMIEDGENPGKMLSSAHSYEGVPLSMFRRSGNENDMIQHTMAIISKGEKSIIEERLIGAMRWVGRATLERRRDEAFLLCMIALESIILGKKTESLGSCMAKRVASLLEKEQGKQESLCKTVKNLYNIRSRIAHSGYFNVREAQLKIVRHIAIRCI
ncbi:MAG TPA: hypothetical protein VFA55_06015, partial [Candidatus Kapabacteria bacterium]|nr:hypothetical protein [Candidatus Kapabacteria bacterium]